MIHSERFHIIFIVIECGYRFTKFPVNGLGESAADAKISLSVVCRESVAVCICSHKRVLLSGQLRRCSHCFNREGEKKKCMAFPQLLRGNKLLVDLLKTNVRV